MASAKPAISIGLPVRNGASHVRQALESILAQTYTDFELIISDNASNDGTWDICREYAARDRRVVCLRNETDEGAAANFRKVFHQSRGEYFKWAAHDDELHPDCLARCLEALQDSPEAVLAHTRVSLIDAEGESLGEAELAGAVAEGPDPVKRFGELLATDLWCQEVFGLIRRDVLAQTGLIAGFVGSDRILRAELGLRGPFRRVDQILFYSRDHAERSVRAMPAHHQRGGWFDPRLRGKRIMPHWRLQLEYMKCIGRAPLPASARLACYTRAACWPLRNLNWARLAADPLIALFPGLWRVVRLAGAGHWKGMPAGPQERV